MKLLLLTTWAISTAALVGCIEQRAIPNPQPANPISTDAKNGELRVISRAAWTDAPVDLRAPVQQHVTMIVVSQCDRIGAVTGEQETAAALERIRKEHVARRFADIGWHFAVDRAGRVWELRPLQYEPQATRGHNPGSIAVTVLGNYDKERLTSAQKSSLRALLQQLEQKYALRREQVFGKWELVRLISRGTSLMAFVRETRASGQI